MMALWHVPPPFAGSDPCDGAQMETIDQLEGGNSKTANTSDGTSSLFRPGSRVNVVSNTAAPLGGGGMGMGIIAIVVVILIAIALKMGSK